MYLYGCENLLLIENDTKEFIKIEQNIVRRMVGIQKRCQTKSLFRTLSIKSTRTQLVKLKLCLYSKLLCNSFTNSLLTQLKVNNIKNSFIN